MTSAATQAADNGHDPHYTYQQAGEYSGWGARMMRRLVHEHRIDHVRIGGRVFIRRSAIDAYSAAHTVTAGAGRRTRGETTGR